MFMSSIHGCFTFPEGTSFAVALQSSLVVSDLLIQISCLVRREYQFNSELQLYGNNVPVPQAQEEMVFRDWCERASLACTEKEQRLGARPDHPTPVSDLTDAHVAEWEQNLVESLPRKVEVISVFPLSKVVDGTNRTAPYFPIFHYPSVAVPRTLTRY